MQALERGLISNDWIVAILLISLSLIFVLKIVNSTRLFGYAFSFFIKGFIEKRTEENPSFFSVFHSVLVLFSILISSLFTLLVIDSFSLIKIDGFSSFWQLFLGVLLYIISKFLIDFLLSRLFRISTGIRYFLFSKYGYFYTINIWLYPGLILYVFSFQNNYFLIGYFLLLLIIRFVFIVSNNKNLIFSKLFYFILYICAFEIAPLFILYKLMIK